jgi:large subunit ribosomal protein L10
VKRSEKQELVNELQSIFSRANTVMVFHYKGLTVADMEALRKEGRGLGIGFKVIKNSLASIALKDTNNKDLDGFLVGPSAMVWGEDPVACAKVLSDFAKKNQKLQVVGGVYSGNKLMANDVKALASLPPFEEIRGKLVGLLVAAAIKVMVINRTPATNVIGVLKAYAEK